MKLKFLANNITHKRFDYSPRYYDERKERLELKKKEYERLEDPTLHGEDRQAILRRNMQDSWSRAKTTKSVRSTSNLRIVLLIGILLVLGYFVFNGLEGVDKVVKKLW